MWVDLESRFVLEGQFEQRLSVVVFELAATAPWAMGVVLKHSDHLDLVGRGGGK